MAFAEKRKSTKTGKTVWDARWDVYINGKRKERSTTFDTQREANAFLRTVDVRRGNRSGEPFTALADAFLAEFKTGVEKHQREESTLRQYRQHVNLHIKPDAEFAALKCGDIGVPEVQEFLNQLYARISPVLTAKVRTTLSQIFKFGARSGHVQSNPVRETKIMLTSRTEEGEEGETFILPSKDDLRQLLKAVSTYDNTGRAEAVIRSYMYAGLRASELRGLPRRTLSLDAEQPKLRVVQRADKWDKIGPTKSKMSCRDIVLGPETVKALKHWLEAAPESAFVFPNEEGNVLSYANLWHRFWVPLMNHAGLVTDEPASATVRNWSKAQEGFRQPRFGFHMLRHVYASLQIKQGVRPKQLQALMGHSTFKLTMDTYGHLWPDAAGDELAANVERVLG